MAGSILRDVESIRDGLMAVGGGAHDVEIETAARDELAELASAANAMIVRLRLEGPGGKSRPNGNRTWAVESTVHRARLLSQGREDIPVVHAEGRALSPWRLAVRTAAFHSTSAFR